MEHANDILIKYYQTEVEKKRKQIKQYWIFLFAISSVVLFIYLDASQREFSEYSLLVSSSLFMVVEMAIVGYVTRAIATLQHFIYHYEEQIALLAFQRSI